MAAADPAYRARLGQVTSTTIWAPTSAGVIPVRRCLAGDGKVMFRAVCPGARSDLAPAPVAGVENIDIDKLINQHVNGPNGITVYRLP